MLSKNTCFYIAVFLAFNGMPARGRADEMKRAKPIQGEKPVSYRFTELADEVVRIKDRGQLRLKLESVPGLLAAKSQSERHETIDGVVENLTNGNIDKEQRRAWLQLFHAMRLNDEARKAMASRLRPDSPPKKKEFIYDTLSSIPCKKGDWLDYRFDGDFLREQKGRLHHPFIGHVYSVYPERGFPHLVDCLADADEQELLAAHALLKKAFPVRMRAPRGTKEAVPKQDVLDTIESLARREEWWVRLYAAHILRKNPSYRAPEVLHFLQQDENELIRLQTGSLHAPKRGH